MCVPATAINAFAQPASTQASNPSAVVTGDEIDGVHEYEHYTSVSKTGTIEYHYRDSYFTKSSFEYDPSLSTMSFNLTTAAFGSTTGSTDEDYANADSNVKDLLWQLGFEDYAVTEEFHKVPTTHSIGAAIAHKEIVVDDQGTKRSVIAIAIRGASYQAEWGGNATIGKTGEAEGFSIARDTVVKLLNQFLIDNKGKITENPKFWIVGFSRASAVANLTSNYLNRAMEIIDGASAGNSNTELMQTTVSRLGELNPQHNDLFCYGYEVPAGGSNSSIYKCATNYKNIWNIVDPTDLVPLVAPEKWGFIRYGTDVDPTSGVSDSALEKQLKCLTAWEAWNKLRTTSEGDFKVYDAGLYTMINFIVSKDSSVFSSYKSKDKSYKATYLKELIEFTASTMVDRDYYVKHYQPLATLLTEFAFNGGDVQTAMDVFKSGAGSAIGVADKVIAALKLICNPSKYRGRVGELVQKAVHGGITSLKTDSRTKDMFTAEEFRIIEESENYIADLIAKFLIYDNSDGDGTLIPTAVKYMNELISAHTPEYVMAYLRAKDPLYTNATTDSYRITLSGTANGGAPQGCEITIRSGDQLLAEVDEEGNLTNWNSYDGGHDAITKSNKADGSVMYTVPRLGGKSTITVEIKGTRIKASKVYLNYYNYSAGSLKNREAFTYSATQWFEGKAISLVQGDTLRLECASDDGHASFSKQVTQRFELVSHDEEGKIWPHVDKKYTAFVEVDGVKDSSASTRVITVCDDNDNTKNLTWKLSRRSYEINPVYALQVERDAKGNVVLDGDHYNVVWSSQNAGAESAKTWSQEVGLGSTSQVYWIACAEGSTEVHKLTPGSIYDDGNTESAPSVTLYKTGTEQGTYYEIPQVVPGETIKAVIDPLDVPGGYVLGYWDGAENLPDLKYTDSTMTELTFSMPDEDVSLTAVFMRAESQTMVIEGGWDAEMAAAVSVNLDPTRSNDPAGWGWALKHDNGTSYLKSNASGIYSPVEVEDPVTKGSWYFLKATPYRYSASGRLQKFLHWSVVPAGPQEFGTYSDIGREYNIRATDENGTVTEADLGDAFDVDGYTGTRLAIDGRLLSKSAIRVVPVYTEDAYSYSVTKADGSVETGYAKSGDDLTIDNTAIPTGYEHSRWVATCSYSYYTEDENGFMTSHTEDAVSYPILGGNSNFVAFAMPSGDVEVKAVNHGINHTLTVKDLSIEGQHLLAVNSTPISSDYSIYSNTGSTVRIYVAELPEGYQLNGTTESTSVKPKWNAEGRYFEFTMPNADYTLALNYKRTDYELTFENATARYSTEDDTHAGETLGSGQSVPYKSKLALTSAAAPEGRHFAGWNVTPYNEGAPCDYEVLDDGTLELAMPHSAVTVKPVYAADKTVTVDEMDLEVAAPVTGEGLSGAVTATGGSIEVFGRSDVSIVYCDESGEFYEAGTVAQSNQLYTVYIGIDSVSLEEVEYSNNVKTRVNGNEAIAEVYGNCLYVEYAFDRTAEDKANPEPDADAKGKMNLAKCAVTLSASKYVYNGKVRKPVATVKANGKAVAASNYTVKYAAGCKKVGSYKVTITAKSDSKLVEGSKTLSFQIVPKATKLKSVKAGAKSFTAKWAKRSAQTTGYQIRYSTKKSMKGAKVIRVKGAKKTKKAVRKLRAGKRYYVQVRCYKTVKGKRYYSSWSAKRHVKVS